MAQQPHRRTVLGRILPLALGLLAAPPAQASTVLGLDEAQLVQRSDCIAAGSVIQTEVVLDADQQVRTHVQLQVHQGMQHCQEGQILTLDLPGGVWGGIAHRVAGVPQLVPGQLVVAFLQRQGSCYRPLGLSLGVYYVEAPAAASADYRVHRKLDGLQVLAPAALVPGRLGLVRQAGDAEPLQAFLARLRQHLEAQATAAAAQP